MLSHTYTNRVISERRRHGSLIFPLLGPIFAIVNMQLHKTIQT